MSGRDKQDVVELFGVMALFFNERVERKDVPDGLYRYDLRGSDDDPGLPVSVENYVFANHAATILTARPLQIPEQGFLPLGEELTFTGDEMTVSEFKNKYAIPELLGTQQKSTPAVSSHKAARRKPSIKAQLAAAKAVQAEKPAAQQRQKDEGAR